MNPKMVCTRARRRTARSAIALLAVVALQRPARAQEYSAPLVNGSTTTAYPSTGALLFYSTPEQTTLETLCSGTLVGCNAFLTAAHCVCDTLDAQSCLQQGPIDVGTLRVFFQHAGFFEVTSISIHPDFDFAVGGDAAVLELGTPVTGISPSPLHTTVRPEIGSHGTIVGFGNTDGRRFAAVGLGIKREGPVTTGSCGQEVPEATHVCWDFDGTESNICSGDSGGPLFLDVDPSAVAGVTSGHARGSCQPLDTSFDTDVFVHRDWIAAQQGVGDSSCSELPAIGGAGAAVQERTADLGDAQTEFGFTFGVNDEAQLVRVALNGNLASGQGPGRVLSDFDLYVKFGGAPAPSDFDCADEQEGPFGYCELEARTGQWGVLVTRFAGAGTIQVTATVLAGFRRGDANCDGHVTAADVVDLVRRIPFDDPGDCGRADVDADGQVDAGDVVPLVEAIFLP